MIKETYQIAESSRASGSYFSGSARLLKQNECNNRPLPTKSSQQNTLTKKRTYVDTQAAYEKRKISKGGFIGY